MILSLALLVAACAPGGREGNFRDPRAPIYSSAVLDPGRLGGSWTQVAAFGPAGGCAPGGVAVMPAGGAVDLQGALCLSGRSVDLRGPATITGPGRITPAGGPEWWVLWVDGDYRTMAIGTPSGEIGFVLDRGPTLPADRLAAVREVFAFNGYDPAGLQVLR